MSSRGTPKHQTMIRCATHPPKWKDGRFVGKVPLAEGNASVTCSIKNCDQRGMIWMNESAYKPWSEEGKRWFHSEWYKPKQVFFASEREKPPTGPK